LRRRQLTKKERRKVFADNGGKCHICKQKIPEGEPWDADHVIARWVKEDDSPEAHRPAHYECHKRKTKNDQKVIAKIKRIILKRTGGKRRRSRPMPGTKASGWRKRMNGDVERR